ncbi:unnamed protein product [Leuciscus chuanchicus]
MGLRCKQELGSTCLSAHSCETAAHAATESTEVQSDEETKPTSSTLYAKRSIKYRTPLHCPITSECRYGVLGREQHSLTGRLKIMELQAERKGLTHLVTRALSSSDSSKARLATKSDEGGERGGEGGFKGKKFSSTGEQLEAEANQRAETRGR